MNRMGRIDKGENFYHEQHKSHESRLRRSLTCLLPPNTFMLFVHLVVIFAFLGKPCTSQSLFGFWFEEGKDGDFFCNKTDLFFDNGNSLGLILPHKLE